MTVAEAAAQLGLHPETLRRAARAGKLAYYKLQGCIRISADQLSDYLAASLCPILELPAAGKGDAKKRRAVTKLQQSRRFTRVLEWTTDNGAR